jgi:hypothetical protein
MSIIRGDDLDEALRQEGNTDLVELMPKLSKMEFRSFIRIFEELKDHKGNIHIERELLQKSIEVKVDSAEIKSGGIQVLPNDDRVFSQLNSDEFEAVLKEWNIDSETIKKIVDLDLEGFCFKIDSLQQLNGTGKDLSDYYGISEAVGDKILRKSYDHYPMIDADYVKQCLNASSSASSNLKNHYTPEKTSGEESNAQAKRLKSSNAQTSRITSFQSTQSNLKKKEAGGKGFGGRSAKKVLTNDLPKESGTVYEEAPVIYQIVLKNVNIYIEESLTRLNKNNCSRLMQKPGWIRLTSIKFTFMSGEAEEFEEIMKRDIQKIFTDKLGAKKLSGEISVFYLKDRSSNPTALCHLNDISMDSINSIARDPKVRWLFLYIDPNVASDDEDEEG